MTESIDHDLITANIKKITGESNFGELHFWLKSLTLPFPKIGDLNPPEKARSFTFPVFYNPDSGKIVGFFSVKDTQTHWCRSEGFLEGKLVVQIDCGEYKIRNGKPIPTRRGSYRIEKLDAKTNNEKAKSILEKTVETYNSGTYGFWP